MVPAPCAHRLLQAGRRLAGRRGQGDERRALARRGRLRVEEGEDAGHRGRLARPGPAGDDRRPAQHGGGRGHALEVGRRRVPSNSCARPVPEQVRRRRRPPAPADRSRSSVATRRSSAQSRSRYRVDPSRCSGRSSPDERARRHAVGATPSGSGQGSAPRSAGTSVSASAVVVDGGQVDADVAQARRPRGEGGAEATTSSS